MPHLRHVAAAVGLSALMSVGTWAQEPPRKLVHEVEPQYSAILKDKQIGGVVKIVAIVAPSGSVKATQIIGGNSIFVTAAQNAVKQWKYAPASTETEEVVTIRFDPTNHR